MNLFRTPQYDLKKEITILHAELALISDVKEFKDSTAWERVVEWLVLKVDLLDKSIIGLAGDPIKNEKELVKKESLRTAFTGLMRMLEITVAQERGIRSKLKRLEETAKKAELAKR